MRRNEEPNSAAFNHDFPSYLAPSTTSVTDADPFGALDDSLAPPLRFQRTTGLNASLKALQSLAKITRPVMRNGDAPEFRRDVDQRDSPTKIAERAATVSTVSVLDYTLRQPQPSFDALHRSMFIGCHRIALTHDESARAGSPRKRSYFNRDITS